MWVPHKVLFLLFFIAASHSHPRKNLEKLKSNDANPTLEDMSNLRSTRADSKSENAPPESTRGNESDTDSSVNYAVLQKINKPKILVTYGNVYKANRSYSTSIAPFQNILLYFLMNLGRELNQSPIEESFVAGQTKQVRSPDFFGDVTREFTDITDKIVNGTKDVGKKVHDTYKTLSTREVLEEDQNEETHYFPHVGGTCMCFNRMERRGMPEISEKREISDDFVFLKEAKLPKVKKSVGSVKSASLETKVLPRLPELYTDATKITELKTENHNVPSANESQRSTVSVDGERTTKNSNNTIIRVVRVMDYNTSTTSAELTGSDIKKEVMVPGEEIIVDLQLTPEAQAEGKTDKETVEERSTTQSRLTTDTTKNGSSSDGNKTATDLNHDESYYFLSSSGGTGKRTTASNKIARELAVLTEIKHAPAYNSSPLAKQRHTFESKKRKKRVRRHSDKFEKYFYKFAPSIKESRLKLNLPKDSKIQVIEEKLRSKLQKAHHPKRTVSTEVNNFTVVAIREPREPTTASQNLTFSNVAEDNSTMNLFGLAELVEKGKYDINGSTNMKSVEDIMKFHNWQPSEEVLEVQRPMVLSVTLPTIAGAGLLLLLLCYVLRTNGWCCKLFTDKSRVLVVQVSNKPKEEEKLNIADLQKAKEEVNE